MLAAALIASGAASAQSPGKLTDPQVAGIAYTANNIDIETAQLAPQKSKNPQVVAFAEEMARDHTAVNEKALALLKKLNVQPQDNDTSRALARQAEAERQKLSALHGVAFDKAYAENELAYHRQVNDALRGTLVPSASNPGLKQLLATGLKILALIALLVEMGYEDSAPQESSQYGTRDVRDLACWDRGID